MKLATILRELSKPEEERSPDRTFDLTAEFFAYLVSPEAQGLRATGSFYPSGLDGCGRALAFNYLKAPINTVEVEPRLQITVELGHYIHDRFQKMFEKMAHLRSWDFDPEVRILRHTNPWFVSGRCDGIFVLDDDSREGVEIKSINKRDFDRLYDGPLLTHQFQGNIYQGLLHLPRMHYVYICKDNSQVKIFAMPYDKELFHEAMVKIERILLRLQKGKLPKKITPDCVDPKCKFHVVCADESITVERLLDDAARKEIRRELYRWKPTLITA
jgi:hypothetical protein